MKKHPFLLVLAIIMSALAGGLHAQISCLPDGISFTSQTQIDSFPVNYPGCTMIEGSVFILEDVNAGIISLDSLYPISSIGGDLQIGSFDPSANKNVALEDLKGLESLTAIGGSLLVSNNASLKSLDGLDNLTSIGNSIYIGNNDPDLGLSGNPALISLYGLHKLTDIPGDLHLYANNALVSLNGLSQLQSIGGKLSLGANDGLMNLNGLEKLTYVGGSLTLFGCDNLKNLSGLDGLTAIDGLFRVIFNVSLTSLTGLDNLEHSTIQYIMVRDNPSLSLCEIQPICAYIQNGGSATITNNFSGCNTQEEVEDACQAVSVDDLLLDDAIQLFPNPTTGIVQLEMPIKGEWKVGVRDATGRMIIDLHEWIDSEIDLSGLQSGVYFLTLSDGQQWVVKRVVKE